MNFCAVLILEIIIILSELGRNIIRNFCIYLDEIKTSAIFISPISEEKLQIFWQNNETIPEV
jgi:hypothetical protein